MSVIYNRVALIGLGLIAGSMSLALRRAGFEGEITGYARTPETRQIARDISLVDRVCETAADAARDADLVVLCVPVGAMGHGDQGNCPCPETRMRRSAMSARSRRM